MITAFSGFILCFWWAEPTSIWEGRRYNHQGHHSRWHLHPASLQFHLSSLLYGPLSPECPLSLMGNQADTQKWKFPISHPSSADTSNCFACEYLPLALQPRELPCPAQHIWCLVLMNYTLWHEFPKRPKVISYKSSWYDSGGLSKHCSKPWDWQLINREATLGTEMLQIKQHILKEDAKNRKANLLFPKCTAPLVLLNMPCSQSQHNRWVSALKSNMKEACVSLACFLNSHSAEWFEVIEKESGLDQKNLPETPQLLLGT